MSGLLTPEQLTILFPGIEGTVRMRHIPYGTPLREAVTRPGPGWAVNAVLAGHVPSMDGLDLMLRARTLLNRSHLAQHEGVACPQDWDCLDVASTYRRWSAALQRECRLYLTAARTLS